MTVEQQDRVINDLQDFLTRELTRATREIEGVPGDVRDTMNRALKGALDYVMNDIHPEGDNVPNFMDFLYGATPETPGLFQMTVAEVLMGSLKGLSFKASEQLIEEVLGEVGRQFANPEGPDFGMLVGLPGLVLLEPEQTGELMGKVRDGVIEGTSKVVMDLALEEKYQRAAINALKDGMRHVEEQF